MGLTARASNSIICTRKAEVAELVDALGSGSSILMDVGVRVPPSAKIEDGFRPVLFYAIYSRPRKRIGEAVEHVIRPSLPFGKGIKPALTPVFLWLNFNYT